MILPPLPDHFLAPEVNSLLPELLKAFVSCNLAGGQATAYLSDTPLMTTMARTWATTDDCCQFVGGLLD